MRGDLNSGLHTASASTPAATRRGYCNRCDARAGILAPIDCGRQFHGNTLVPGTQFSYNPDNLDPFDYYNTPGSPGYVPDAAGIARRVDMIGKPAVRLYDAQLSEGGAAQYLALGNVDISSVTDQNEYTTKFKQFSVDLQHEFSDAFRVGALYGESSSRNVSTGLLAEIKHLNAGFDAADPAQWEYLTGHSSIRHFRREITNTYKAGRLDFTWEMTPGFSLKFGGSHRVYTFQNEQYQRTVADSLNPSFAELGVTMEEMTRLTQWGTDVTPPDGTTTQFLPPDLEKFQEAYDFRCNCVNELGDFRITYLNNAASQFGVTEKDTGGYAMLDFNTNVLGLDLRGDVGLRFAHTDVQADGLINTSRPISNDNSYDDWLPSMNLVWEATPDLLFRFAVAKVMARPILYYTKYPLSAGSCEPGYRDSPLINDFVGSQSTLNFDMSAQVQVTDFFSITVDALNLTDQTSDRYAYADDPLPTSYIATGRQFFVGGRLTF